jgi:GPH family glycoside/pentoside/hexuronide:cation symporter
MKYTLKNKQFLLLCSVVFLVIASVFLVMPFGSYVNIYYVYGGDKEGGATIAAISGMFYGIAGMLWTPVIVWFGNRYDKKIVLMFSQGVFVIASLLSWVLYSPKMPYLQLIYALMACQGLTCVWIMTSSMLADICDLDELKSGARQEGMYGAVFAWVFKLGISGVMILSGYMMNWSGFDQSVAVQSVSTIFSLRILYALVPAVGMIIAISTMAFYSITKARALEIRKELDIRKSLQTA